MQKITILGSTGTIGQQTLEVIALHPNRWQVFALSANHNVQTLFAQCLNFNPTFAVMFDPVSAKQLDAMLKQANAKTIVLSGSEGLVVVSEHEQVDIVMAAIVGASGLLPALAAAKSGKKILLANKETLVMAGRLFMQAVKEGGATLLPIDSEHNAIFQVLPKKALLASDESEHLHATHDGVSHLILTASGGPFRQYTTSQLQSVTPALALKHPNWVMGAKITIDSSTLMNKGLEVIEAYWLFNVKPEQIEVVIHPQSVIHSMVAYVDGSVLAQLGHPDMRTPIAYGLAYPQRIASGVKSLSLIEIAKLEFEAPDIVRFPCLRLAYDALKAGGTASTILNAANEVLVSAFLQSQISYLDIPSMLEDCLAHMQTQAVESISQLIAVDHEARCYINAMIAKRSHNKHGAQIKQGQTV